MSSPLTANTRVLPFRNASAGANRPRLFDKVAGRPSVPVLPMLGAVPMEEQDARLSGMTRSLHRRTSGLNFPTTMPATQQKVA